MNLSKVKLIKSFISTLVVFIILAVVDGTDAIWALSAIFLVISLLYFSIQKDDSTTFFSKPLFGASKPKDISTELLEVKKLYDEGILTESEYDEKSKKLKSQYLN
ncbi:SHOCT domain-containing protein [Vibrio vulnificus]|uniref:SHOCT domain-containing protein n=1 Tax=Vibrio vulnificus TaxID=672 RepID=UPI00307D832A